MSKKNRKAVVLVSGGIDSTVGFAWMLSKGYTCYPLHVNYGQINSDEDDTARDITNELRSKYPTLIEQFTVINLDIWSSISSALIDGNIEELDRTIEEIEKPGQRPSTYVPARNLILLSLALGYAESIGAANIFIGCYPGGTSPDCSKKFAALFEDMAQKATEAGRRGTKFKVSMFKNMNKPQIILLGQQLGVDFANTMSCFQPIDGTPCCRCDACATRASSFEIAGIDDPLFEEN